MTDKADLKTSSTTVSAQSRAFWRVHTILDESSIFSLKIEQNHSSPITKFITDLTNTLLHPRWSPAVLEDREGSL